MMWYFYQTQWQTMTCMRTHETRQLGNSEEKWNRPAKICQISFTCLRVLPWHTLRAACLNVWTHTSLGTTLTKDVHWFPAFNMKLLAAWCNLPLTFDKTWNMIQEHRQEMCCYNWEGHITSKKVNNLMTYWCTRNIAHWCTMYRQVTEWFECALAEIQISGTLLEGLTPFF